MSYDSDGCSLFGTEICVGYDLVCYTAARTLLGGGAASLLVETICRLCSEFSGDPSSLDCEFECNIHSKKSPL